jgi:hypothetical protein
MRISRLFKRLRRWSSQAFRKRHSPAAFRTCRNAGNSALTAEGTTSKWTRSISCEGEFCIFYRLSLRTLRTKDVHLKSTPIQEANSFLAQTSFSTQCFQCFSPQRKRPGFKRKQNSRQNYRFLHFNICFCTANGRKIIMKRTDDSEQSRI